MSLEPLLDVVGRSKLSDVLNEAGLVGHHSFIRKVNADYDARLRAASMIRSLPPECDYRFVSGEQENERWVFLEKLAWDSEFFGRGMARFDGVIAPQGGGQDVARDAAAIAEVLEKSFADGVDYVLGVIDAVDLHGVRTLSAAGFELIEVRCHYHMPLTTAPIDRYATRLAIPADVPSLARAARVMVNPYDRFHADPAIAPADADRLMERWVEASVIGDFADATVVPDMEDPEAFCTAKYHRQHWDGWGLRLAQPVLSAVSPKHRGWYVKIISELNEHLRSVGAEHAWLITQITNNAVIRCWEKLGYQFGKGEYVFRKLMG